jgi:DNA transformation protein
MAVSATYLAFVKEQLESIRHLADKRMFGGVGLYADAVFFGLIDDDTLYLKVDDRTRPRFEQAGSGPFRPDPKKPEAAMSGYYNVPVSVLEDRDALGEWAREAIAVGASSGKKKATKTTNATAKKRPAKRR